MKIKGLALATVLALPLFTASAGATTYIASGSTAAEPYIQALAAGYKADVDPSFEVQYNGDGGNAGVKDVQAGTSQFAGQSVPATPAQLVGTNFYELFLDGLCIDVNPSNKLTNITTAQTANIFTGTLTNWGQVGGSGLSTTIDSYGRSPTAGTYTFFTSAVLDGATQGSNVTVEGSDGLVKTAVANDANGIGYIGLAYQGAGIKALDVNGVACNTAEIKTKTYPLWRYIWLVLPSTGANPTVVAFENWITTSVAAGEIISSVGGVPEFNPAPPPTKAQQLATAEAKCKKEAKSKQAACIKAAKKKY